MSIDMTATLLTSDDLFAMRPSKKVDRWLFRGELRESKVTKRNPNHSAAVANCTALLKFWQRGTTGPRGRVYSGEVYFRIRQDPETNVGIDVALSTDEQRKNTNKKASFVDGPPLLAVEVLSPYDKQKDIDEAIEEYLDCGVKLLWIVDPIDETVTVYRHAQPPQFFNISQELEGGPELPGFRCAVADIFE